MPGEDRMGPMGQGPMTGRGLGWCRGADARADMPWGGPGSGRGRGEGRGRGRQNRRRFFASDRSGPVDAPVDRGEPNAAVPSVPATQAEELDALKQRAVNLEHALAELQRRLEERDAPAPKTEATPVE